MAEPSVGDTVDIHWGDGRRDAGIVEQVLVGTLRLRVQGPPEITIVVAQMQLSEAGPRRWTVEL